MKEFIKGFIITALADYLSVVIVYKSTFGLALEHIVLAGILGGIFLSAYKRLESRR